MLEEFQSQKVLFISTKNLDYIRNQQEIRLLIEQAKEVTIIASLEHSYLKRLMHVYWELLKVDISKYDSVFVGFAPQLIIPLFWHKLRNKELTIDFFISLYDTLCLDRKKIKPTSLFGRILHSIDERTLKKAKHIICDTNAHGKFFVQEFHADATKFKTLYLEADPAIYHAPFSNDVCQGNQLAPLTKEDSFEKKAKESFEVLYFGSVLPLQGTEIVLKAYDKLKENTNMHFVFIGPIKNKRLRMVQPISNNIEYIDWLTQEQLAERINHADLCLAGHFHPTIEKAQRTIPGKAFIYEAMGKPMILGDNPANHEYFSESTKHIFVPMGDANALAESIRLYYRNTQFSSTI